LEDGGAFAPDGRRIAYRSSESGRPEIYVRDVRPEGEPGPGKWQISNTLGRWPRWRRDGRELFYVVGSSMMAVELDTGGTGFHVGAAAKLFELPPGALAGYDVTADGQRFLVSVPTRPGEAVRVLVNWLP
jgi:hypothetical protein